MKSVNSLILYCSFFISEGSQYTLKIFYKIIGMCCGIGNNSGSIGSDIADCSLHNVTTSIHKHGSTSSYKAPEVFNQLNEMSTNPMYCNVPCNTSYNTIGAGSINNYGN